MDIRTFFQKVYRRLRYEIRLRQWNRLTRDTVTTRTRHGIFTVLVGENESIGQKLYTTGTYELEEMQAVFGYLRSIGRLPNKGNGVLLDVGANNGVICVGALHTGEMAHAIALEPAPRSYELLVKNVAQNGLQERIHCIQVAASDRVGWLAVRMNKANSADDRTRENGDVQVRADTLDNLVTQPIDLIWMDVQGYEGYVLRGAQQLLAQGMPAMLEIFPQGIRQAGMSEQEFIQLVTSTWKTFTLQDGPGFVAYPIAEFSKFFSNLDEGHFRNVIFTA